jgi:hypothetical protein
LFVNKQLTHGRLAPEDHTYTTRHCGAHRVLVSSIDLRGTSTPSGRTARVLLENISSCFSYYSVGGGFASRQSCIELVIWLVAEFISHHSESHLIPFCCRRRTVWGWVMLPKDGSNFTGSKWRSHTEACSSCKLQRIKPLLRSENYIHKSTGQGCSLRPVEKGPHEQEAKCSSTANWRTVIELLCRADSSGIGAVERVSAKMTSW